MESDLYSRALASYQDRSVDWYAELFNDLGSREGARPLFLWATACVRYWLEQSKPGDLTTLRRLLDRLIASDSLTAEEWKRESETIFYISRDPYHVAISHLYAGLGYLLEGSMSDYRWCMFATLEVIMKHSQPIDDFTPLPLKVYQSNTF